MEQFSESQYACIFYKFQLSCFKFIVMHPQHVATKVCASLMEVAHVHLIILELTAQVSFSSFFYIVVKYMASSFPFIAS